MNQTAPQQQKEEQQRKRLASQIERDERKIAKHRHVHGNKYMPDSQYQSDSSMSDVEIKKFKDPDTGIEYTTYTSYWILTNKGWGIVGTPNRKLSNFDEFQRRVRLAETLDAETRVVTYVGDKLVGTACVTEYRGEE